MCIYAHPVKWYFEWDPRKNVSVVIVIANGLTCISTLSILKNQVINVQGALYGPQEYENWMASGSEMNTKKNTI